MNPFGWRKGTKKKTWREKLERNEHQYFFFTQFFFLLCFFFPPLCFSYFFLLLLWNHDVVSIALRLTTHGFFVLVLFRSCLCVCVCARATLPNILILGWGAFFPPPMDRFLGVCFSFFFPFWFCFFGCVCCVCETWTPIIFLGWEAFFPPFVFLGLFFFRWREKRCFVFFLISPLVSFFCFSFVVVWFTSNVLCAQVGRVPRLLLFLISGFSSRLVFSFLLVLFFCFWSSQCGGSSSPSNKNPWCSSKSRFSNWCCSWNARREISIWRDSNWGFKKKKNVVFLFFFCGAGVLCVWDIYLWLCCVFVFVGSEWMFGSEVCVVFYFFLFLFLFFFFGLFLFFSAHWSVCMCVHVWKERTYH